MGKSSKKSATKAPKAKAVPAAVKSAAAKKPSDSDSSEESEDDEDTKATVTAVSKSAPLAKKTEDDDEDSSEEDDSSSDEDDDKMNVDKDSSSKESDSEAESENEPAETPQKKTKDVEMIDADKSSKKAPATPATPNENGRDGGRRGGRFGFNKPSIVSGGMPEKKPVVGLSWQPQLPFPSLSKATSDPFQAKAPSSTIWKPNSELVSGLFVPPNDPRKLNRLLRQQVKDTAGKQWFDMPAQTMTPELQRDLKLLKLRDAIDPKRHYKKGGSKSKTLPKYFQVGTIVGSPLDYFSGRLTKKERKETLADELLADQNLSAFRKRKVREIEEQRQPAGNENWKIKGQSSRKRAKERRRKF